MTPKNPDNYLNSATQYKLDFWDVIQRTSVKKKAIANANKCQITAITYKPR